MSACKNQESWVISKCRSIAGVLFHLHATLLEQPFHKLPVGLGDHGRRQVGEFRLSQILPEAAGLLHVLLKCRRRYLVRFK